MRLEIGKLYKCPKHNLVCFNTLDMAMSAYSSNLTSGKKWLRNLNVQSTVDLISNGDIFMAIEEIKFEQIYITKILYGKHYRWFSTSDLTLEVESIEFEKIK